MSAPSAAPEDVQAGIDLQQVRERMAPHRARVAELLRRYPQKRGALLQVLWLVQEVYGWVPRAAIKWAAETCAVSPVHAYGVAEFYTMYHKAPVGRYLIQVCQTMCCQLYGAEELIAHLERTLGIGHGETTPDGLFTLMRMECLAACSNGPAVLINDEFLYGPGDLNEPEEAWHPAPADLDRWIERLRAEAAERPEPEPVDALGGIVLDTRGHPGAEGATAEPLPEGYAPAPPALKVAAERAGAAVTVRCLCAPECTRAVVERSDDDGATWQAVGEVDVTQAPGVPGPPGGPKQVSWEGELEPGRRARYRLVAFEGERQARPSAAAEVTAAEPPPAGEGSP